jgi:hypothetical protein
LPTSFEERIHVSHADPGSRMMIFNRLQDCCFDHLGVAQQQEVGENDITKASKVFCLPCLYTISLSETTIRSGIHPDN